MSETGPVRDAFGTYLRTFYPEPNQEAMPSKLQDLLAQLKSLEDRPGTDMARHAEHRVSSEDTRPVR